MFREVDVLVYRNLVNTTDRCWRKPVENYRNCLNIEIVRSDNTMFGGLDLVTPGRWLFVKINAELIVKLRKAKHWTQEELAIACGLNVRTIQ